MINFYFLFHHHIILIHFYNNNNRNYDRDEGLTFLFILKENNLIL